MSYLADLTLQLAAGSSLIENTGAHIRYVLKRQNPDGGFSGRSGNISDPYYTSFGVRTLGILGVSYTLLPLDSLCRYLRNIHPENLSALDMFSWVGTCLLTEILGQQRIMPENIHAIIQNQINTLERPDGMYAKTAQSAESSTYQTFMAVSTLDLMGIPILHPEEISQTLLRRQNPDGGFSELFSLGKSGINPTAAAVATLSILGKSIPENVAAYLLKNQMSDGGWRAATSIPASDLLSTFTALIALRDCNASLPETLDAAKKYALKRECTDGGFTAAESDSEADVEYTFYGSAIMGMQI